MYIYICVDITNRFTGALFTSIYPIFRETPSEGYESIATW